MPQWNGNITVQKWKTTNKANTEREYCYQYDSLNRIKSADYGIYGAWKTTLAYDEDSIRYDENGNIRRYMRRNQSGVLMDDMTYNYFGTGNRLAYISDKNNENFPRVDGTVPQYYYDANGNMASDKYKNDTIYYNILNLPGLINFGNSKHTDYIYTATGEKIKSISKEGQTLKDANFYAGNMVYGKDTSLAYILMDEGRIVKSGSNFTFEYNVKDHLGNTRMVLNESGATIQETHYYPFGLEMAGMGTSSSTNKYLYNGKEKQTEFGMDWLDYGFRFYDPQIGRWWTQDARLEKYFNLSPYTYCLNNPIHTIDPDGRDCIITVTRDGKGNITGVTISATIYITGVGLGSNGEDRAEELNDASKKMFSSQNVKGNIKVSFDIQYKYKEKVGKLQKGENVLNFVNKISTPADRSHVNSMPNWYDDRTLIMETGKYGEIYKDDWEDNNTVLHETGHFLGLSDRYAENNQLTHPYFNHDLMGDPRNSYFVELGNTHYLSFLYFAQGLDKLYPKTYEYQNRIMIDIFIKGNYHGRKYGYENIYNLYPATDDQKKMVLYKSEWVGQYGLIIEKSSLPVKI